MSSSTNDNKQTGQVRSPQHLAHVVLRSPNFKASVAFYKAFLGGHASYENEMLSFITYDHEHHRIAIANVPSSAPKNRNSAGLEHIAFGYDKLEDLLVAYKQRKALGMDPIWCTNHGVTLSMYYQDPDGNQLETQVDAFETVEEANAFMDSEEFAENPIGVDFDPEEIIRRFKSGESTAAILKRERQGARNFDSVLNKTIPAPDLREFYPPVPDVEL